MPDDVLVVYRRFRRATVGVGAAAFVAFNGLIALQSWHDRDAALRQAQQAADHLAKAAELHVSRTLLQLDAQLGATASRLQNESWLLDHPAALAQALRLSIDQSLVASDIGVLNGEGKPIVGGRGVSPGPEEMRAATRSGGVTLLLGRPARERRSGAWMLPAYRFAPIPGQPGGGVVVVGALPMSVFQDYFSALGGAPGAQILVLTAEGDLLSSEPFDARRIGAQLEGAFALGRRGDEQSGEPWILPNLIDGKPAVTARAVAPLRGLVVVASQPLDRAMLGWRETALSDALTSLLVSGLVIGASGFALLLQRRRYDSERARRAADMMLAATLERMGEGIAVIGLDGRLRLTNERARRLLVLPDAAAAPGVPASVMFAHMAARGDFGACEDPEIEARRRVQALFDVAGPSSQVMEAASGATVRLRRTWLPDGGVVLVYADISDRISVEAALSETNERLRRQSLLLQTTLENMLEGIAAFDSQGRLAAWNDRVRQMFDLPEGLLRLNRPYRDVARRLVSDADDGETITPDGARLVRRPCGRYVEIRRAVSADGGEVMTFVDVTAAKRAEIRLRDALTALGDQFILWGPDGRLVMSNLDAPDRDPKDAVGYVVGASMAEAARKRFDAGVVAPPPGVSVADAVAAAVARRLAADGRPYEVEECSGRVFRVSDYATAEGDVVTLRADVTALKAAERAALEARDAAEAANRAKTRFLSSMSHELRTPLNAILGFAQLLQHADDVGVAPEERGMFIAHITSAGEHLLKLVGEALDLSRIESGGLRLRLAPLLATEVMSRVETTMSPIAAQANVSLQVAPPAEDLPAVKADPLRLMQILLNLCANGVKYNHPGGRVTLTAELIDDQVCFVVEDDGVGIPEDRRDEVFEPFNRLGAEFGKVEGAGVGLALCRELAQRMGGDIQFRSAPGVGSRFWVTLPALDVPPIDMDAVEDGVYDDGTPG